MFPTGIDRRTALKLTGGSLAAITTSGLSSASEGNTVRINVGYDAAGGRKAALDAASDVVREYSFDALTVEVPEQAVSGLENDSNVRYVERDGTWQALDASCRNCGVSSVNAPGCSYGGGASVAIIDSGIQSTHPDLDHVLGIGRACARCLTSPCICFQEWDDENGHGTGVACVVHSVAPEATLHAVKVLSGSGTGTWSDVACGIEWTANQGIDVGNLSVGGGHSSLVEQACSYAYNRGTLLVAAAGNDSGGSVSYPAAYNTVMAVSALDCNDNFASYSNTGPEIEIAAPGSSIETCNLCSTCGGPLSGTSFAAPHVSGGAAAVMALGYSAGGARQRLKDTAVDVGLSRYEQGAGKLDISAATC